MRLVIIGNSGGGKSTLARRLANQHSTPCIEVDRLLWQPGWVLTAEAVYRAEHARLIADESWIIEGLGCLDSIADRLGRATDIILVDMPLWMHFWLAAERQIEWATGAIKDPPAGVTSMPPTDALFRTIAEVDETWMPFIREATAKEAARGKRIYRIADVDELTEFELPHAF